jgi:hypothetical protein
MKLKIATRRAMKKQIDRIRFKSKLIKTLKMEGLSDLVQDYIELGIDSLFDEGIAKDIPIIRTIVNFAKVVHGVRDRLYLNKLLLFLQKVADTSKLERVKFIEENCKDKQHFEQNILLIIEQADRMEKAALIGKVFKACILGQITYKDVVMLSSMINKAMWSDLEKMLKNNYTYDSRTRLFNCGLLSIDWIKKIEQGLNQNQIQRVAFDGFKFKETKYTKMLKAVAGL